MSIELGATNPNILFSLIVYVKDNEFRILISKDDEYKTYIYN